MKKKFLAVMLLAFILPLCGCGQEGLSVEIAQTDADAVVQGASEEYHLSVVENGVLRIKDNHLTFFDFGSKKDYVICSRANCRHNDKDCSGWYNGWHGANGLAAYGGSLYCFMVNKEKNTYELIKMDMDGSGRRTVASIDMGDFAPGKWQLDPFTYDTYYANNKAITTLPWEYAAADDYEDNEQTNQCIVIDMETGEITEVTERSKEKPVQCLIDAVSRDRFIVRTWGFAEKALSEDAFYEKLEQGEFDGNVEITEAQNPYEAYYTWYAETTPECYQFISLDLGSGESTLLQEGVSEKKVNLSGYVTSSPPFYVSSIYGSNIAIMETFEEGMIEDEENIGTVNNKVYLWDLESGEKKQILDLADGYVFDAGGLSASVIIDGDKLLFLRRKPNLKADYYSYSLATGEEEFLYEAARNVPYRIIGETSDSFVYYTADDEKKSMYIMKKEDYHKGDFSNSVRLEGLDEYF